MNYKILFFLVFLFSCGRRSESPIQKIEEKKQVTESPQKKEIEKPPISKEDYYFDFDKVLHYKLKEKIKPYDIQAKSKLNKEEEITYKLYFRDYPKDLKTKSFLKEIKSRYDEALVDTSSHKAINEIFCKKTYKYPVEYSCIPEYRDILVFYKKKKVIGLAKICFSCKKHHILGTTKKSIDFGQDGDFEKLEMLLSK